LFLPGRTFFSPRSAFHPFAVYNQMARVVRHTLSCPTLFSPYGGCSMPKPHPPPPHKPDFLSFAPTCLHTTPFPFFSLLRTHFLCFFFTSDVSLVWCSFPPGISRVFFIPGRAPDSRGTPSVFPPRGCSFVTSIAQGPHNALLMESHHAIFAPSNLLLEGAVPLPPYPLCIFLGIVSLCTVNSRTFHSAFFPRVVSTSSSHRTRFCIIFGGGRPEITTPFFLFQLSPDGKDTFSLLCKRVVPPPSIQRSPSPRHGSHGGFFLHPPNPSELPDGSSPLFPPHGAPRSSPSLRFLFKSFIDLSFSTFTESSLLVLFPLPDIPRLSSGQVRPPPPPPPPVVCFLFSFVFFVVLFFLFFCPVRTPPPLGFVFFFHHFFGGFVLLPPVLAPLYFFFFSPPFVFFFSPLFCRPCLSFVRLPAFGRHLPLFSFRLLGLFFFLASQSFRETPPATSCFTFHHLTLLLFGPQHPPFLKRG